MLGEARRLTPHEGGPSAVIEALVACMSEAAAVSAARRRAARRHRRRRTGRGGRGSRHARARGKPAGMGAPGATGDTALRAAGAEVKLGNDVSVAANAELLLGAGRGAKSLLGRLLGDGRGRRRGARWRAVARSRRRGGDRSHGRQARGRALWLRPARLHGGLCGTAVNGSQGKAHGRDKATTPTCSRSCASATARRSQAAYGRTPSSMRTSSHERLIERAVKALGSGIASAVNLLDVELVLLGGGLGTRFGEPMLERILAAMKPHLFKDDDPPTLCACESWRSWWRDRRGAALRALTFAGVSDAGESDTDQHKRQRRGEHDGDPGQAVEHATATVLAHHAA